MPPAKQMFAYAQMENEWRGKMKKKERQKGFEPSALSLGS